MGPRRRHQPEADAGEGPVWSAETAACPAPYRSEEESVTEPDSRWVVDVSSYPPPAQLDIGVVYAVLEQITADPEPDEENR